MFTLKVALVLFTIAVTTEGCDLAQEYTFEFGVADPNSKILFVGNGELSGVDCRDSVPVTKSPGWNLVDVIVKVNTNLIPLVNYDSENQIVNIFIKGQACSDYKIDGYYLPQNKT